MKRWLSVLVVFSCIIALFGCENGTIKGQVYFNAQVLEVNKGYIKVRCVETFNSGISVDEEFSVTTDVVSNSEVHSVFQVLKDPDYCAARCDCLFHDGRKQNGQSYNGYLLQIFPVVCV